MKIIRALVVYIWAALVMITASPLMFWHRWRPYPDIIVKEKFGRFVSWFAGTINRLAGIKLEVYGSEKIPEVGALLFVGNHQSYLDIPVLLAAIPRPVGFVAKKELLNVPLLSQYTKELGSVFIERGESRKALEAIVEAAKLLKSTNHGLVVFPEGTRSADGKIGTFKAGSMKIATKSKCTIIPFALDGTYRVMPKTSYIFMPNTVKLTFFDPIRPDDYADMDTNDIAFSCQRMVKDVLEESL